MRLSPQRLAVPPEAGVVRFSRAKAFWLWLHLVLAVLALSLGPPSAGELIALAGLTLLTLCLGHSVGLHRGIIHRTFEMSDRLRCILVGLFVFTGLGGPQSWIRLHYVRDYWQNQPNCPPYFAYKHGLARDLYWNLHCRFEASGWGRYGVPARWESDRWLRVVERTWWLWSLLLFGLLCPLFGWRTALLLGPARVAGSILGHWFIGYWTHKHGARRFRLAEASEEGTNSTLLGWISFGEGFHNNHHAIPDSARMGHARHELDLGWVVVLLLERLGLVWGVKSWSRGNVAPRSAAPLEGAPRREPAPGLGRRLHPVRPRRSAGPRRFSLGSPSGPRSTRRPRPLPARGRGSRS